MTKQIFANGVAKFVPVLGGIASGGLTFVTFRPMAMRLQRHLADLEIDKPRDTSAAPVLGAAEEHVETDRGTAESWRSHAPAHVPGANGTGGPNPT